MNNLSSKEIGLHRAETCKWLFILRVRDQLCVENEFLVVTSVPVLLMWSNLCSSCYIIQMDRDTFISQQAINAVFHNQCIQASNVQWGEWNELSGSFPFLNQRMNWLAWCWELRIIGRNFYAGPQSLIHMSEITLERVVPQWRNEITAFFLKKLTRIRSIIEWLN